MKKFKCVVTRTDEYEIEFDENKINEEWMKEFRQVFYSFYDLEEHAEHLAQSRARFQQEFIEGYGVTLIDGRKPYGCDENDVETGINIKIISEDNDCEVDVTEIK